MAMTRRLALVIHGLSGGGAERVLVDMANHWAAGGDHVTLITLAAVDTDVYRTDPAVKRVGLDVMGHSPNPLAAVANNWRRVRALRAALRDARPDFVVSFTDQINVLTLMAARRLRLPVIICDRVDPRHHPLGRAWSLLRGRFYRRCFAAVVQTAAVRDVIAPLVGTRPVYVIPNAVSADALHTEPPADSARPADADRPLRAIAMGRLETQKGFDILIDAFATIAAEQPEWVLEIFGEGPLRAVLERQIDQRGLVGRVRLPGWTDDRLGEMSRAHLFVLSSRYEGFPNVLLDALSQGLPVVSAACDSGPAEIVREGIDGLLVESENTAALAAAMRELMADQNLRREFGRRATEVVDRFSGDRFYARWEAVFAGAAPDDERFATAASVERP